MAQQIASMFVSVGADLTGLTSGLSQARGHLDGFAGQMASVGGNMQRIGLGLTAAVTTPIVGAGVASLKMAADFESATNILAIAARESGTPLEDLHDAALLVGKDAQLIGIDAMEAADAMTTFYKTGFTTSEVMGDLNTYLGEGTNLTGMLRAAIDLAAASDLDLARASDAVAIAIKTFGLNSEDATAVANSFVGAADASVAEVSDLTDAMYTFGPTANQYGWSLQDANTALAILSERGIRGSEAGTALRSMMTNMMRDTDDTTAALDALNISLYDQEGQMRTLPDIMGQLTQALSGLSDEERNYYIQTLAGTYGMKAMATLVAEGPEGWAEMEKKIAEAATAQEVGEQRTRGMTGALEQFQGALQTLGITAGETFLPTATDLVEHITAIADAAALLPPDVLEGMLKGLGALALGGPILLGVGSLVKFLAVMPGWLLAGASAAVILGGALWFGSDKGKEFADSLWRLDETVLKLGGPDALAQWIGARQAIAGAQATTAGITTGEGTPESRKAAQDLFGYPDKGQTGVEMLDDWGYRFFGSGDDPGMLGNYIYDMFGYPEGINEYGGVLGATAEDYAPKPPVEDRIYAYPTASETARNVFGYPDYGQPGNMWGHQNEWLGINEYGGVGSSPYGPGMATPALSGLFGEDLTAPFMLSPGQTPEEVAALAESVLPAEGSLSRSVTIVARPDEAQLERSADEVAAAWERAIAQRLERLKRNKMVETGGLLEEAAAVGMAR